MDLVGNYGKIYASRAYVLDSENNKIYSKYSEVEIKLTTPRLEILIYNNESDMRHLQINKDYYTGETASNIDKNYAGEEFYYCLGTDSDGNPSYSNSIVPLLTKDDFSSKVTSRVYMLDSNNNKYYSDYSPCINLY